MTNKKAKYWTGYTYRDDSKLHCTHKFLGNLSEEQGSEAISIIDKYWSEHSFQPFSPLFDQEDFFGSN